MIAAPRAAAALLLVATAALGGCGSASSVAATPSVPDNIGAAHILVDQFGYRPQDPKVAVIRNPRIGFDSGVNFTPGAHYQVRRVGDDAVMFEGAPVAWAGGAVEPSSGDQGWWFDFSALRLPGRYVVYDLDRKQRSAAFGIDSNVYRPILKAAVRMYFYQRSGMAKKRPFAAACWTDAADYVGRNQDTEARDVTDRGNPAKIRDLSGGWSDAGDTNKYVTFAMQPVHQLLTAYEENPAAFTDDFNIPESGNGIPDVLDEVKWETDWLKKMQFPDGSVALKVGETVYGRASPPSSDTTPRYYVPSCTSATIAAAGMFAHASYVYSRTPQLTAEAQDLKSRALKAWNNYQSFPQQQEHCDIDLIHGGNADLNLDNQNAAAAEAAIYLSAITGESAYHDYVKAHYRDMRPYHDFGWSRYAPDQGEALLFYTIVPGADPAVKAAILQDKGADIKAGNQVYGFNPGDDLYRAFMHDAQYHWGSNNPRASYGNTNMDVLTYQLAGADADTYRTRALEILHYFHGVNPLGLVYLSNMYSLGATRSANEIFHTWFQPDTRWSDAKTSECGPPPGYVPAGPNTSAAASGVPAGMSPPNGQPPQKSYRDWNGPDASWAVSEPGIYYQSAFVKLIAAFSQAPHPGN